MPLKPAVLAIIYDESRTKILLTKRRDVPVWVLPGGGIEPDESLEEAIKREVLEETGIKVLILRKCAEYTPINRLASFTTLFLCQVETGSPQLSDETAAVAFFPFSDLPSDLFTIHAQWIREAFEQRGLIQRKLTEVTYSSLALEIMRHPWRVLRYAWTRFSK